MLLASKPDVIPPPPPALTQQPPCATAPVLTLLLNCETTGLGQQPAPGRLVFCLKTLPNNQLLVEG